MRNAVTVMCKVNQADRADDSTDRFVVRAAVEADLPRVKAVLDAHRHELGFVPLPALRQALARGWLYVAVADGDVFGMIDWWARRDGVVVLYNVAVLPDARLRGAGLRLVRTMIAWAAEREAAEIRLKCPESLPSNTFYAHLGFTLIGWEAGKRRPLNCWSLRLDTVRPPTTVSPTDDVVA